MLTGGMSLDDAIGLIKRPGKDILDSLGDEHWIWLVIKTDKNGNEVLDADGNPVRKSGYLKPRTKSLQEIVRGQKEVRFTSEIDMDDGQLEHEKNLGYHGRTKGGQVIDDVEAMQTAEDNLKNR